MIPGWVIISAISGIGYGTYKGIEDYRTIRKWSHFGPSLAEGIKSAFAGFFAVGILGGFAIWILTAAIAILIGAIGYIAEITEAVANYLPFGWFFVSTGCAISVFMGIITFRNQEEDGKFKILKTLLTILLSYVAFGIIMIIVSWVTKVVANSLPFAWFFVSIGCAASIFVAIITFRNQGEGDKYRILKTLLTIPLSYIVFGIIVFIVDAVIESIVDAVIGVL